MNKFNPDTTIKLEDGKEIRRIDTCFTMRQHKSNDSIFGTIDGAVYVKEKSGAMRRLTKKHIGRGKQARALKAKMKEDAKGYQPRSISDNV